MLRIRIALGSAGILLGLFGVFRLLTQIDTSDLEMLFIWLVGALILHDGILSPIVAGVGWGMAKVVPPRARRYLQGALITAVGVTVIAIPMIHREGTQPASKALLEQNFKGNLALILGIIAAVALLAYVAGLFRERRAESTRRPQPGPGLPDPD
jgi:hypothetical protein